MPFVQNLTTMKRPGVHLTPSFPILALILLTATVWAEERRKDGHEHWVGTWTTALHEADLSVPGLSNVDFDNQTLRQIVYASVGGNRVRVRLFTFGARRWLLVRRPLVKSGQAEIQARQARIEARQTLYISTPGNFPISRSRHSTRISISFAVLARSIPRNAAEHGCSAKHGQRSKAHYS